jgi:hypothetical protein
MRDSERILRAMGINVEDMINPPLRQNDVPLFQIQHNFNMVFELIAEQEKKIGKLQKEIKKLKKAKI